MAEKLRPSWPCSLFFVSPGSSLGNGAIHLPGDRADVRFQTQASDDLFERRVIALRGQYLGGDLDVSGVGDIGTIDSAKSQAALGQCVQQKRSQVRFFATFAGEGDRIASLGVRRRDGVPLGKADRR